METKLNIENLTGRKFNLIVNDKTIEVKPYEVSTVLTIKPQKFYFKYLKFFKSGIIKIPKEGNEYVNLQIVKYSLSNKTLIQVGFQLLLFFFLYLQFENNVPILTICGILVAFKIYFSVFCSNIITINQ